MLSPLRDATVNFFPQPLCEFDSVKCLHTYLFYKTVCVLVIKDCLKGLSMHKHNINSRARKFTQAALD